MKLATYDTEYSVFCSKRDEVTGKYFSIVSYIKDYDHRNSRNTPSLISSEDAERWQLVTHLIDIDYADELKVGFQYVAFDFEGNDIIFLSQTAINGAVNFHDANSQTFHLLRILGIFNLQSSFDLNVDNMLFRWYNQLYQPLI